MPNDNQTPVEDHPIIEITSSANNALFSTINDAVGKAHISIKA